MPKIRLRFDFKKFFDREAVKIITAQKRMMSVGRGLVNDTAPKHKNRKNKKKWLVDTGETSDKGMTFASAKHRLLIFPSGKRHSRGKNPPTYRQLYRWHNRGLNTKSPYSGVLGGLPLKSAFPERFRKEAIRQLKPQIVKAIRAELKRA